LLHLADRHPAAGLAPALGTAERAQYYKWMVWLVSSLQPLLSAYFYPERWVEETNEIGIQQVKARCEARAAPLLDQLEAQLAAHGGPWLLGEHYSAVDAMAFMLCRWTRLFARPARSLPLLSIYLQRMLERPALQRVLAAEGLAAPWV
jgi:glutathione S-transferase